MTNKWAQSDRQRERSKGNRVSERMVGMGMAGNGLDLKTIRMIAVDVDGTLLGLDGKVSERNRAALAMAAAAGVEVVIATGRRHSYAMRVLRGLGLSEETVLVSSNGAVVRTLGARLIERMHMAAEGVEILFRVLGEFRNALVVTFDKVGADGEDARGALVVEELADLHTSIGRWMEANEPYLERVEPLEQVLGWADAPIQAMLAGTVERMRLAEARLVEDASVAAVGENRSGGLIQLNRTEYSGAESFDFGYFAGGVLEGGCAVAAGGEPGD